MKRIEVSDEQYEYIQSLRGGIAESVVGEYGFVRERDAIQFLIDNLDGDAAVDVEVALERTAVDDVSASVRAAIAGEADPEGATVQFEDPDDGGDDGADAGEEAAESAAAATAGTIDHDGTADDDDMLDEMMNLLDTHEDKWEESSAADYRYSVSLPDGTTEDVQTKDDVRALLFQHYR